MAEHPIEGMMGVTMEKIRQLVDANTIIGEPITVDGATIIPISRVTFGFASGGSDVGAKTNKQMFGGGTGAGVSIAPIAFLVISGGNVRTISWWNMSARWTALSTLCRTLWTASVP